MQILSLSLSLLLLVSPVVAGTAKNKSKPKPISLQELTALAWKTGTEKKIGSPTAENMGFPGPMSGKAIRIKIEESADKSEHVFFVVSETSPEGNARPQCLVFMLTRTTKNGNTQSIDGIRFRTSLNGELTNALKVSGLVGEVEQEALATDSQDLTTAFEKEKSLFLNNPPKSKNPLK